jgi:hypothetical protein
MFGKSKITKTTILISLSSTQFNYRKGGNARNLVFVAKELGRKIFRSKNLLFQKLKSICFYNLTIFLS